MKGAFLLMIKIIRKEGEGKKKSPSLPLLQTLSCFAAQHLSRDPGPYISSRLSDLIRTGFCSLGTAGRGVLQPPLAPVLGPEESNLFWCFAGIIVARSCWVKLPTRLVPGSTEQSARGGDAFLHLCIRKPKTTSRRDHHEAVEGMLKSPLCTVIICHPQRHTHLI